MDIIALRCDFYLQNLRNAVKYGAKRRYKTITRQIIRGNINATIEGFC
jgi:hypothetical protein